MSRMRATPPKAAPARLSGPARPVTASRSHQNRMAWHGHGHAIAARVLGTTGPAHAIRSRDRDPVRSAVTLALRTAGQPLERADQAVFGPALGIDAARVRVHHGPSADDAAERLGARAFALGRHVVFAQGEYRPDQQEGRRLLAHELAHVAQDPGGSTLRRFTRAEEGDISTLDEVLDQARTRADATGAAGLMRWGRFVAANGGQAAGEVVAGELGTTGSTARTNSHRYTFTCLCGLVDMRHFFQVMYAGLLEGNRSAVERGREHELHAEETSRFAPEDSPSNALGALFGSEQSWVQRQSVFVSNLRGFLQRCHPVDYDALPEAERRQILDWYAVSGTSAPAHPNEQAFPNMERIASCGGLGMFPFVIAGEPGRFNRLEGPIEE